jgi:hypothetical protein
MLEAGASRIDVTPKSRVFLAGFSPNRLSEGVHDKLFISAVAVRFEDSYIVLASIDLLGLFKDFLDPVRVKVAKDHGLRPEEIIFCCTHTHSGPDTLGLWGPNEDISGVEEEYMEWLGYQLAEAVDIAVENMVRVKAKYSWTLINPRGIVKNSRNPGLVDRYLSTLRFCNGNGRTVATVVNFACHPEVLANDNKMVTSDYVYYLRLKLEEEVGGITVFLNGSLGGMLTPDVRMRSFEEAERVGSELARWVNSSLSYEREIRRERIWLVNREFSLPVKNQKFIAASERGILKRKIANGHVITEVNLARIGEVTLITIPGEALPRFGMEVRGILNGQCKVVAGLGNDEIGYIIPADDWMQGKYEESMSLGPETAPIIEEEIKRLVLQEA